MQQALDLASRGIGLTSPNPAVGALVVEGDDKIIGRGTHTYEGVKHAEVLALEQAGTKAQGATLYLTLEPCSHQGRTGPCVDAIIAAGIKRVVAATHDPNPRSVAKGSPSCAPPASRSRKACSNHRLAGSTSGSPSGSRPACPWSP